LVVSTTIWFPKALPKFPPVISSDPVPKAVALLISRLPEARDTPPEKAELSPDNKSVPRPVFERRLVAAPRVVAKAPDKITESSARFALMFWDPSNDREDAISRVRALPPTSLKPMPSPAPLPMVSDPPEMVIVEEADVRALPIAIPNTVAEPFKLIGRLEMVPMPRLVDPAGTNFSVSEVTISKVDQFSLSKSEIPSPFPVQILVAAIARGPCRKITDAVRNAMARKPRLNCGSPSGDAAGALFLVFRKNDWNGNFI